MRSDHPAVTPLSTDYRILGVPEDASMEDIKNAYHRAAKRNHPDLHPEEVRGRQQLKMMRINEAYLSIVASRSDEGAGPDIGDGRSGGGHSAPSRSGGSGSRSARTASTPRSGSFEAAGGAFHGEGPGQTAEDGAVGRLKDPAYTYYKLGFNAFQAGYTELFHKDPREIRRQLRELRTADAYILTLAVRALRHFEQAYRYFLTVVQSHPDSIWVHDARWKLRRVENFSQIYQRICERLTRDLARAHRGGAEEA